jgi:hypothetical protein
MMKIKSAFLIIALTLAGAVIAQQRMAVFDAGIGGNQSQLNITAAAVINPRPCVLWSIVVINPGAGDSSLLTINDTTTIGGASSSNVIFTSPSSGLSAGQLITLKFPITSGITVSSVPGGGASINVAYSYSAN